MWFFQYRKLPDEEYNSYRFILINKKVSDTLGLSQFDKILDKQKDFLLVATKNAMIEKR